MAHGQEAYANRIRQKAIPILRSIQPELQTRSERADFSESLLNFGQDSAALALALELIQQDSIANQFGLTAVAGIALANLGDTAAAQHRQKRAEIMGNRNRPYALGFSYAAGARIPAALGHDDEAIALSTQALVYGQGALFRNAALHNGEFARLRCNPEFLKLLKPRDD